jgi:hypothetical protein
LLICFLLCSHSKSRLWNWWRRTRHCHWSACRFYRFGCDKWKYMGCITCHDDIRWLPDQYVDSHGFVAPIIDRA